MARTVHGNGFFHPGLFHDNEVAEKQVHRAWVITLGILFVILGTVGIALSLLVTLVSILYLGVLLLIGGIAQVVQAFSFRGWREIVSHLLIGILYFACACVVITNPLAASATVTLLLALGLIFIGVLRGFVAVEHREEKGWIWSLVSAALSVILGGMIIAQWPASALWVIGLLVSIEMIFHGWAYIGLGGAMKKAR